MELAALNSRNMQCFWDQQGSAEEALEVAYCDLMMGLKFPASTYLLCELSMLHNGNN